MPQPPDKISDHQLGRWQFSLRGMFLFTLSVAIGAVVVGSYVQSQRRAASQDWMGIREGLAAGLLATLIFWMVLGLLYQVRDLRNTLASNPRLTPEQHWGARLEIFWRLALVSLFGIYALVVLLVNHRVFIIEDREVDLLISISRSLSFKEWSLKAIMREAVLFMLLLVLVGSVPCTRRKRQSSPLRRWLWLITLAVLVAFCLELLIDKTFILHLVHISTLGIDYAFLGKNSAIKADFYTARTLWFFWMSLISGVIVLANGAVVARLARQWPAGIGKRVFLLGILIAGVTVSSANVIWIYRCGIREISPYCAETCIHTPLYFWLAAILLVIIPATILAYRMTVQRNTLPNDLPIDWRINPNKYYHERRLLLILLLISMFLFHLGTYPSLRIALNCQSLYSWHDLTHLLFWKDLVQWWFYKPDNLLCVCFLLLTIKCIFSRRDDPQRPIAALPRINPAKFVTVWLATMAVMLSGIPTLVWMSFALWFNPWFRGRWP